MSGRTGKKLVLAVIDSLAPALLDRALSEGRAPVLAELVRRGVLVRDCVSTFPSLTPVAAASIATAATPDRHLIPSMNWYHRGEARYIEYGSSFAAAGAVGFRQQLQDTVYNLNLAHLSRAQPTVFERLEDAGLRTAGTTYLIYRGRTRHPPGEDGVYPRIARLAQFRHAVYGPTELFYADLFSSRRSGCRSLLGMPARRDEHAACVGAHLVEHDLFDFLLLSLPDTDTHSHRHGPDAQVDAIAAADRALGRVMEAGGGTDAFLEDHAVIVMSDHAQSPIRERVALRAALDGWSVLAPGATPDGAELAVCPTGRFAAVYALDDVPGATATVRAVADRLRGVEGCELVARRDGDEAVVLAGAGELRFAPGGEQADRAGRRWSLEGDPGVLGLANGDGPLESAVYPDALHRLWSALTCSTSGDVLVSAAPGYEFADWGGNHHVGGGSHGSLGAEDSLGVLLFCGVGPASADAQARWTLRDAVPAVLEHFGLAS